MDIKNSVFKLFKLTLKQLELKLDDIDLSQLKSIWVSWIITYLNSTFYNLVLGAFSNKRICDTIVICVLNLFLTKDDVFFALQVKIVI